MKNPIVIDSAPIRTLFEQFMEELEAVKMEGGAAMKQAAASIDIADRYLGDLRQYITAHPFANDVDEIAFFKQVKPAFAAQLHYFLHLHSLLLRWPIGSKDKIEEFILTELNVLHHFFSSNSDFYRYCRSEETILDSYYFLRKSKTKSKYLLSFPTDIDRSFSTGYDQLAAMLKANDMLTDYLRLALDKLLANEPERADTIIEQRPLPSVVPWRASVVDLAELLISLHAGKVFGDDPKWTLNRLATAFSQIFGIKLSNISKLKTEISLRKHRARFLEQRINDLHRTLDEEDEKRL